MSSKRGRKRNDNLPPNRARDVQRAFRARRAAHLQALEQRVSELEEENGCLRQALNLPPSNRPPLGKGPTGKDKPKLFEPLPANLQSLVVHSSHDSSPADSPASRGSSQSPGFPGSMTASRSLNVIEPGSWGESILLSSHPQHHLGEGSSSSSQPYLAPMTAPLPLKPLQYPPYTSNSSIPSSRPVSHNEIYIPPSNQFGHPPDRPLSANYTPTYSIHGDLADEVRTHYNYTPTHSFASSDPNMHSDSPPPPLQTHSSQQQSNAISQSAPSHTHVPHQSSHNVPHISQTSISHLSHNQPSHLSHPGSRLAHTNGRNTPQTTHPHPPGQHGTPRDMAMAYTHRRNATDSFSLGQGFPHLPNPASFHHDSRPGDYFRPHDNLTSNPRSSAMYNSDARPHQPSS